MDFVRYLIQPERWEVLPPPWEELFGREAPLCVEIGFGNGEFLAEVAKIHADCNWIGFETSLTCIVKAGKKLAQARVENVRLALVDGKFALRELFREGSVYRVYVNFPCPWPKSRHAYRRLVDEHFAQILSAVLAADGEFSLVTDALWYAEEAKNRLSGAGLVVHGPDPLPEGRPGTRYERKWRSRGLSVWQVVAKTTHTGKLKRSAGGPMPHAKVGVPFEPRKIAALVDLKETWQGGTYVVKQIFFSSTEKSALLRVFSTDQGFTQHFFLTVSAHQEGLIVQLDGATVPFRTPAVKRAVAGVAKALGGPCSSSFF